MIRVIDIWDECKKIVGNASDEFMFRRLTDAIELLASKGDFDALLGTLDICASSKIVTLPPEVETILAVNMVGVPALARDELFQFHLNGPGSCGRSIRHEWMDMSQSPTYREIACPGRLYGYCATADDNGAELWVEGLDESQNVIRTEVSPGVWRNGAKIPVHTTTPGDGSPYFSRITRVQKPVTYGPLRMTTVTGTDEILLGVYQAHETTPLYRRIQLSSCVDWVRIRFRRRSLTIRSKYDLIPIEPTQSVIMALRALKAYDEPGRFAEGEAFEATAVRWMVERQHTLSSPTVHPIQMLDGADALLDKYDVID